MCDLIVTFLSLLYSIGVLLGVVFGFCELWFDFVVVGHLFILFDLFTMCLFIAIVLYFDFGSYLLICGVLRVVCFRCFDFLLLFVS